MRRSSRGRTRFDSKARVGGLRTRGYSRAPVPSRPPPTHSNGRALRPVANAVARQVDPRHPSEAESERPATALSRRRIAQRDSVATWSAPTAPRASSTPIFTASPKIPSTTPRARVGDSSRFWASTEEDRPATTDVVLEDLVFSHESPSAITGSLRAAYENAATITRSDLLERCGCASTAPSMNSPPGTARHAKWERQAYFKFVSDRAALFAGLSDATISHDEGWHFLVLGRSIERVDMTCRLLDAQLVGIHNSPDWLTLLRAAGAMSPTYVSFTAAPARSRSLHSYCSTGCFRARCTTRSTSPMPRWTCSPRPTVVSATPPMPGARSAGLATASSI